MSDELQKKIFSENLNRLLQDREKTQSEVAKEIDVSPQTFNTWTQGIRTPDKTFNCPVKSILF